MNKVPQIALWQTNTQNADFANFSRDNKDIYLSYSVIHSEEIYYSKNTDDSHLIMDSLDTNKSDRCYEVNMGAHNYDCRYSLYARNCMSSSFLFDCVNCKNCFLCANLRNKEFCFLNKQYGKEDYLKKIEEYADSWSAILLAKRQFKDLIAGAIHKYAQIIASDNSSGNDLADCKNVHYGFSGFEMENVKYATRCLMTKDCMDICHIGRGTELIYESVSGGAENSQNLKFGVSCLGGLRDAEYAQYSLNCQSIFACIGLRNKQHCILNKQYTKEEYEVLVPKIIEHMNTMPYVDKQGRIYKYGEFFPSDLSPFSYNETIAQEYFPLTKAEALTQGYRFKDPETKQYNVTLEPQNLPDHIKDVDDSVLNEVIGCAHKGSCNHQCITAFKLIPAELQFYKRMNLPLPRLCPNCRHYERLAQRNPLRLWTRQCMCNLTDNKRLTAYDNETKHSHGDNPCYNAFETSYAPNRQETVYCEECYNAEVV